MAIDDLQDKSRMTISGCICLFASCNTNIGIRPGFLPPQDFCHISRGIMHPMYCAWMFPDAITNRLMTGMFALIFANVLMAWVFANPRTINSIARARSGSISRRSVNRNNRPTDLRISPRGFHRIHTSRPCCSISVAYSSIRRSTA
jgi:hypothetical protein